MARALGNSEQHDAQAYLDSVRARFDRWARRMGPRCTPSRKGRPADAWHPHVNARMPLVRAWPLRWKATRKAGLCGSNPRGLCTDVRPCRVNLALPTVEVRFEDLHIETEVYAETSRQLPSLPNAVRGIFEARQFHPPRGMPARRSKPLPLPSGPAASSHAQSCGALNASYIACMPAQWVALQLHILRARKVKMVILNRMSSRIVPGRLTLLLGPPNAGKSTLLKAMAGKLAHHGLKVGGRGSRLFLAPPASLAPSFLRPISLMLKHAGDLLY